MTDPVVHLPDDLRRQIFEHCMDEFPNEGCGMLAVDGERIVRVYPTANADASPVSYAIPPQAHFDALTDAEAHGWSLEGVFHSHPRGPAGLSETDLLRIADPKWVYLVVNLARDEPEVKGWRGGAALTIVP